MVLQEVREMKVKYKDLCEQDKQEIQNLLNFKRKYLEHLKEKADRLLKKVDKVD